MNGVPRRARLVKRHQPLFPQPGVDQRALAHVGPPGHRQANGGVGVDLVRFGVFVVGKGFQRRFDQAADALPVRRRDGVRIANAQFMEFTQQRRLHHAFGLVGSQQHFFALCAQVVGNVMVLRGQASAHIHHKDHGVGLGHRLTGLLGHFGHNARGFVGLKTTGVHHDEFAVAQTRVAIVAVAGQAGVVGHDGVAALGDAVEQGRLAHVGAAHQGNHRLHHGQHPAGRRGFKPPNASGCSVARPRQGFVNVFNSAGRRKAHRFAW